MVERTELVLPEIDVTDEMVEAGAEIIWARFFEATAYGSSEGRDVAAEVFKAMLAQARVENSTGYIVSRSPDVVRTLGGR